MTNITLTPQAVEDILLAGDLSKLSPEQRVVFYQKTCERVGLDPLAKPFDYLKLNGRLVLYANKGCAEQLRRKHNISIHTPTTELIGDIYQATIGVSMADGRTDADIGAVDIKGATGDRLSNAMMKAVTKAKRRATLSIMGLGMLDESELDTVRGAVRVDKTEAETVDRLEMKEPMRMATTKVIDHNSGEEVNAHYPVHKQPTSEVPGNMYLPTTEDIDEEHYVVEGMVSEVKQPQGQKFFVVSIDGFPHEPRESFTRWDEKDVQLLEDAM